EQENVVTPCTLVGLKDPGFATNIECSLRLVGEQSPSVGAHQPWDGKVCTVDFEVVTHLAISHGVEGTAAIECVCARTEPIDGSVATEKLKLRRILVEAEFLKEYAVLRANRDAERV